MLRGCVPAVTAEISDKCLFKGVEQRDIFALKVPSQLEDQVDGPVVVPCVPRGCTAADVTADPDAIRQRGDEALLLLSAMLLVWVSDKKVV